MIIRGENLSRQYFRKSKDRNVFYAVKDLSLVLEPGILSVVTGKSGSGKSTLLNMMSGLLEPTEGKVFILPGARKNDDGAEGASDETGEASLDLYSMTDEERSLYRNQHFGIIPQGQTGLHSLTVLENVLLPCKLYGDNVPEEEAATLLEKVGLGELMSVYPNELSGGEMRRLSIARALIKSPEIIFADEPTGDLDDENTHIILNLLRDMAKDGRSVMLVTHEKEAEAYGDVIYRMKDGGLISE